LLGADSIVIQDNEDKNQQGSREMLLSLHLPGFNPLFGGKEHSPSPVVDLEGPPLVGKALLRELQMVWEREG
ncbi:hypothetical protein ACQP3J_30615, partial [Escherichia coli]